MFVPKSIRFLNFTLRIRFIFLAFCFKIENMTMFFFKTCVELKLEFRRTENDRLENLCVALKNSRSRSKSRRADNSSTFSPTIRKLDLSDNRIDSKRVRCLADVLKINEVKTKFYIWFSSCFHCDFEDNQRTRSSFQFDRSWRIETFGWDVENQLCTGAH